MAQVMRYRWWFPATCAIRRSRTRFRPVRSGSPTRFKSYKSTIIIVECSRIIVVCVSVVIVHHNYHNYNCGNCGISAPNGSNCVDNCDNCGNHNSLFTIMVTIIIVNGHTQLFAQL